MIVAIGERVVADTVVASGTVNAHRVPWVRSTQAVQVEHHSVASSTAQSVALARSQLTRLGVLDDPWAASMLRPTWKVADQLLRLPVLRRQTTGATFSYLAARTLFFDEEVNRALDDGIGRVVIVGAGYDSRAWRLARPSVEFIEIDQPRDAGRQEPAGARRRTSLRAARPGDRRVPPRPDRRGAGDLGGRGCHHVPPSRANRRSARPPRSAGLPTRRELGIGGGSGSSKRAVRSSASAGGEVFRYEPTMSDAHDLLAETGWTPTHAATGRQLAERFLPGTDMVIDLTDDAFIITATVTGDR